MNAIELLKDDHDRVEQLFEKFKENEDGRHGPLFKKIKGELDTHTHIEETLFYPKLLKSGDKELKKIVREGLQEHRQVKMFLKELAGTTAANKKFNPTLKVIIEDVEHHVKEEEDNMFPMVEDQLSERVLENLGAAMQKEKIAYQKKHGIKPARIAPRKGTIETMLDTVTSAVGQIITGKAATSRRPSANGRGGTKTKASTGRKNSGSKKPAKTKAKARAASGRG